MFKFTTFVHLQNNFGTLVAFGLLVCSGCASGDRPAVAAARVSIPRLAARPPVPSILTSTERRFFQACGIDAKINGAPVFRAANLTAWPAIAASAEPSLRPRLEIISQAFADRGLQMKFEAEMQQHYQKARFAMAALIAKQAFSGDSSLGTFIADANDLLKRMDIAAVWRSQREFLEKGTGLRQRADRAQEEIFAGIAQRVSPSAVPFSLSAKLVGAKGQIAVRLDLGDVNIDEAVVHVIYHRKKTPGQWTAANLLTGLGLSMIGIDALDAPTQFEGVRLAAAQEAIAGLPMVSTLLLEGLSENSHAVISLGIPAQFAPQIDHVDIRVISALSDWRAERLQGLDAAAQEAGPSGPERAMVALNVTGRVSELTQSYQGLAQRFPILANELRTLATLASRIDRAQNAKAQDKALAEFRRHAQEMVRHLTQRGTFDMHQLAGELSRLLTSLPK